MNIIQLSPTSCYPPKKGGHHRSHGIASGLSNQYNNVRRLCQETKRGTIGFPTVHCSRNKEGPSEYTEYMMSSLVYDMCKLPVLLDIPYLFLGKGLSYKPPAFLRNSLKWGDVVLVEGPWQVEAVSEITDTPIIYSSHNAEIDEYRYLQNYLGGELLYNMLVELEQKAIDSSDGVIFTSIDDRDVIDDRFEVECDSIVIPNATYRREFKEISTGGSKTICLFIGSGHRPNIEALEFIDNFLDNGSIDDLEVWVAGNVSKEYKPRSNQIKTFGYVEDLSKIINKADIALNPIFGGSGSNIKLFDYFAWGLPVVSTPFGARGIECEHKQHLIVAEKERFRDQLNYLSKNPDLQVELAQNAQELAKNRYTWETVTIDLEDYLRKYE